MRESILYLEERGCNDNKISYDIKNHRIDTVKNIDIVYSGKKYNMFFEFTVGEHWKMRYTNKRTGQPLKNPVTETIIKDGIFVNTQHEVQEGFRKDGAPYFASYRNLKLEREIWEKHYNYSKKSILEIINTYSVKKYAKVVLIEEEAKKIINKIGGWREKDILENDCVFRVGETWTDNHKIVVAYKRVNNKIVASCEIDLITKMIVG